MAKKDNPKQIPLKQDLVAFDMSDSEDQLEEGSLTRIEFSKQNYRSLLDRAKRIRDKVQKNIVMDPEYFIKSVIKYIEFAIANEIKIQERIATRDGFALERQVLIPATLEAFASFNGYTLREIRQIVKGKEDVFSEYGEGVDILETFIVSNVLDRQHLGMVQDSVAKFYLVNNSHYKDVSSIEMAVETKNLPDWIKATKVTDDIAKIKSAPDKLIEDAEIIDEDDFI